MEISMKVIIAVVAAVIVLLIIVGLSMYVRETGLDAIESLWDIGEWIKQILEGGDTR
jgi:hypothetical protein